MKKILTFILGLFITVSILYSIGSVVSDASIGSIVTNVFDYIEVYENIYLHDEDSITTSHRTWRLSNETQNKLYLYWRDDAGNWDTVGYWDSTGVFYAYASINVLLSDSIDTRIITADTVYIYDLLDIPSGTTAQRPVSPNSGMIRYNTDDNQYEGYDGSNWRGLGGVIDADQDTYIIAEKSSGSDEDTLYFHCDTTKVLTIGETEAVTYIPWSGFQNIEIEENAGEVTIMDMPVNTTDGLVQSYGFGIDNNTIMKIKAPADGSGGVDEKQALFVDGEIGYPGIAFIDDLDTGVDIVGSDSLGIFAGAWEGIRVDGTDSTLYFKGQVGDTLKLGKDGVFNGQITFYSDSATPDTCKIVISNYDRLMFWDAEFYWFDAPIYAPGYQGNSDFTIGASGEDVTFEADTLKGSPIWDGIFNCNDTVQAVILYDGTVSITGGDITGVDSMYIRTVKFQSGTDITEFSTDAGLGGDSDNAIPTEKAIKTYTDALVTAQDLDFSADSGTGAIDLDSETFKIKGTANEIVTSATGDSVTLDITILKDIVASGTGMSGGADDVLVGADSDVTITLTTKKNIVAGDGLGGGEDDVLPGEGADVTMTVLLDVTGGLETVDDSINIKLDGATLTLSSSGIKVTDNTYEVQLDNEAGLYGVLSDVSEFCESDESEVVTVSHWEWDSLKVHREVSNVVDTGEITFVTGVAGFGEIMIGDNQEWAQIRFTSAGVVTLIDNSTNVTTTNDTDAKLNIYDGGSGIVIENQLGSTLKVAVNISYYTP